MTNGQIAQLQELRKCYGLSRGAMAFVCIWLDPFWTDRDGEKMNKTSKAQLRRLWHQYRHQVAAMRRNRSEA